MVIHTTADFETTDEKENSKVALIVGKHSNSEKIHYCRTLHQFFASLTSQYKKMYHKNNKQTKTFRISFVNGSRFDFSYLYTHFIQNPKRYEMKKFKPLKKEEIINKKISNFRLKYVKNKGDKKQEKKYGLGEYSIMNGNIYYVNLGLSKNIVARFVCDTLIFLTGLAKMGKEIGIPKGEFDYKSIKHTYKKDADIPKKLIKYAKLDTHIHMIGLKKALKKTGLNLNDLGTTAGSTAKKQGIKHEINNLYKLCNLLVGTKIRAINVSQDEKRGGKVGRYYLEENSKKPVKYAACGKFIIKKLFAPHLFPKEIYRGVRGGLVNVNSDVVGEALFHVIAIDINSSYGWVMSSKKRLAYGEAIKGDSGNNEDLKLYKITISYKQVNDNKIGEYLTYNKESNNMPFLPFQYEQKNNKTKHISKTKHNKILYVTSIEMPGVKSTYHIPKSAKIECIYSYKTIAAKELFDTVGFVSHGKHIKDTTKSEIVRSLSKLFVNGVYGKLLEKNERTIEIINPHADFEKTHTYFEKHEVREKYKAPVVTGLCIAAHARVALYEAAQGQYDKVAYYDTDSLFVMPGFNFDNIKMDNKKLGMWKDEFYNIGFAPAAKKRYVIASPKGWEAHPVKLTVAGFKKHIDVKKIAPFKPIGLLIGGTIENLLKKKMGWNGFYLFNTTYTTKPIYDETFNHSPDVSKAQISKRRILAMVNDLKKGHNCHKCDGRPYKKLP